MSSSNSLLTNLVANLPWFIPLLLVFLVGVALAITFYQRCPKAAMLTILALSLLVLQHVVSSVVRVYLIQVLQPEEIGKWFTLVNAVSAVWHSAALVLLVIAVFVGRPKRNEGSTSVEGYAASWPPIGQG